ncbi:MAG: phosphate ABC transporter permease PstA [Candidatus Nanopelagicaceae bacterium]|jgi:phosphate transport system permease protein
MSTLVKPAKPWRPRLKNLAPEIFGAFFTAFSTLAIVAITPLKGRLGFSISLIAMAIITSASISWLRRDRKAALNSVSTVFVYVAAAFVIIPLASLLFEIVRKGIGGLSWGIFTRDMSLASADSPLTEGGLLHAVVGTLYVVALATIISTPIGFLASLYIVEVKGRFAALVRFFVQAMSGVPSIVAGLFIYAVWMIGLGNSYNVMAGAGALAILMIPTVARTSEEVLKLIPNDLREAGLALGATQWRTIAMIILPAAKSGLVTSVILGIARVAGETAPLLLTIGGADALNLNPLEGNSSALPFYVWKNYSLGNPESIQRAWLGVIVLMIMVFIFFSLARYFGRAKGAQR